ncbi:MAG: mobile mystery protein B [Coxiellaceae bacterium]|nr:mobile mystery protein B [Coxiellaceae bacterium]
MNNLFECPDGATPLSPDELHDLIPSYVTSQGELNAVEQMNIATGMLWLKQKQWITIDILCERFIKQLHKKLFGDVWKWAGKFRKTDKNIGVHWLEISTALRKLVDDSYFQIQHDSYSIDEIAARFHHRLVLIHPFSNGNGRHSRVITDLLLVSLGAKPFSWGGHNIQDYSSQTQVRKEYILALRGADRGSILDLLKFVRQ